MRVLVTGAAGFIGFHTCRNLLACGAEVCGVDNFSPYYDVALKEGRAARLGAEGAFRLERIGIEDAGALGRVWEAFQPEVVVHLAAQAGVRHSIDHPESYVASNLIGTFNVLEQARRAPPKHLLAASTSSVYGANVDMPFREGDRVAHPLTLYAATKGSTELIGHSYAHLFGIPTTFFRFFTAYGPWGRPDMAYFKFTKAILAGEPIDVFNHGNMVRDFTYVDDLVEAVVRLIDAVPGKEPVEGDTLSPVAPHRIVNIGYGTPVKLGDFIEALAEAAGKPAIRNNLPMQPGDVTATHASNALLERLTGFSPRTPITVGAPAFVRWYREFYGV